MSCKILFSKKIPRAIRLRALARLSNGKSLEPRRGDDREFNTVVLLVCLEANPQLTLYVGEEAMLYAVGRNYDLDTIDFAQIPRPRRRTK